MPGRKMNWERATSRDRLRAYDRERREEAAPKRAAAARKQTRDAATRFAREHELGCFKCDRTDVTFAKSGVNKVGAWAICLDCVTRRSAA
jgi:hypothetical protein